MRGGDIYQAMKKINMLKKLTDYHFGKVVPKVLVTHNDIPEILINQLREKCEVTVCEGGMRPDILKLSLGMDGILWATFDKLDAEALDAAGAQLKVVSTMSAGMDYVDLAEVKRRGILLGHTPFVVNDPVADIAIGLMVAAARRFNEGMLKIIQSEWEVRPQWMLGRDIPGSTIGIVGFGGIGQTILKRLKGFDIGRCLYTGHSPKPEGDALGAQYVAFDELLRESDFVFIACPLTKESYEMFNESAFKKMKATSVLINVARGGIIDQNALINALKNGTIFAAGLDVMTPEPLPCDDPLMKLPNCVVVPHLGTATTKSLENMFLIAAHNVCAGLAGQKLLSPYI